MSYIYCYLPVCSFAAFAFASSLLSQSPCGQFQAAAWMFLNMLPLLCSPMESMLITGETFCLQKQNQHSKQIWEYRTISLHSNCHLLPWRKNHLPSHPEYGASQWWWGGHQRIGYSALQLLLVFPIKKFFDILHRFSSRVYLFFTPFCYYWFGFIFWSIIHSSLCAWVNFRKRKHRLLI